MEFIPKELEDDKLYISEKFGIVIHNCACGCGSKTVTPINNIVNGKDYGWKMVKHDDNTISLTPSIGNYQIPCKSHYYIKKNIAEFI